VQMKRIGVLGGGAWGTALAHALSSAGRDVTLYARSTAVANDINYHRLNRMYLPDVGLSPAIRATAERADLGPADVLLIVVPAQNVRAEIAALAGYVRAGQAVVMCAKGIEQATGKAMAEVLAEVLPEAPYAVLSGPSFAADVARGLPAALTLACCDESLGRSLAQGLSTPQMRLYWSSDVAGAELGGATKNVLAIAAGIVAGRGLGASAHAAVVTRGFAELRRFGLAMGARPETLMGLSGLGDLILTCGSPQSRNMSLGLQLGKGQSVAQVLASRKAVTEGVYTAAAVTRIARAKGIEMPIAEAVHAIVENRVSVDEVITQLMQRPLKAED
jgi:glycerol-3-phosphate dehydrogenase (NAD(P)+)